MTDQTDHTRDEIIRKMEDVLLEHHDQLAAMFADGDIGVSSYIGDAGLVQFTVSPSPWGRNAKDDAK